MASNTDLRVRITADLADIKQGLGQLRGELAKVKSQSAQAFSGGAGFTRQIAGMRRALVGLFAGVSAGALFAGIVRNTKEAEEALAQLRAGLKSTGGIAGVTEGEIVALAESLQKVTTFGDDTIIRMASVVATFTNIRGAIFKDAIPAILDLSTRLGTDLNSAAIQVGKALNDPIKGITALGRAGVQFSKSQKDQIKALVETGKFQQAQKIILAELTTQMGGSAAAAADTFTGALAQLKNAFGDLLEGDSANGGVNGAKQAVQQLTAVLQDAGTKQAFRELLEVTGKAATGLAKGLAQAVPVVRTLLQNMDALAVLIGSRLALAAIPAMVAGVLRLNAAFVALRTATLTWAAAAAALSGPVGIALAGIATALYLVYQRTNDAKQAADEHAKALSDNAQMARVSAAEALEEAKAKRIQAAATLQAARAALEEKRARLGSEISSQSSVGMAKDSTGFRLGRMGRAVRDAEDAVQSAQKVYDDWGKRLVQLGLEMALPLEAPAAALAGAGAGDKPAKLVAKSNALMRDSVDRALAELDRLYKGHEVGIAEYFGARAKLQQQAIDLQIQQVQYELAITKDVGQRRKLEEQIIVLQRDRAEVGVAAAREERAASDAMIDKLGEVKAKLQELDGNVAGAARTRIYAEYHELFKQLEASSDATGKKMVQNLVDRMVAKVQLEAMQSKVREVLDQLRAGTEYVAAQDQLGAIGPLDAERQMQALRARSLEQLRQLRQAMADYLATTAAGSPQHAAAVAGLQQLDTEIAQVQATQQQLQMRVKDSFYNSLLSGFDAIQRVYEETGSALQAVKAGVLDFARTFILAINRMAAEALAKNIVQALFKGGSGGGGQGLGALFSSWLSKFFGGGSAKGNLFGPRGLQAFALGAAFALPGLMAFANGGAFTNSIVNSPTLFRFGAGGQFGVMGEAGPEAVMPLERGPDGRLGVSANGAGGRVTTPIVVLGDRAVADALAGAAGRDVVMTHVLGNIDRLRGALG